LVEVAKNKGPIKEYEYFESTSQKQGKPGARLRFKSRLQSRASDVAGKILQSLGIDHSDPRARIFDTMDDPSALRPWDLVHEPAYENATIRRQAAEWAFEQHPQSVGELVAEMQFYDAEHGIRKERLIDETKTELTAELGRRKAAAGRELTDVEIADATKHVT